MNFDDLILALTETASKTDLDNLLQILAAAEKPVDNNMADSISLILENWQSSGELSVEKADFIISLSSHFNNAFPLLRAILPLAIKKLARDGINKTSFIKVLGVRNESVPLTAIYDRYTKAVKIEQGKLFYNTNSKSWGYIDRINWITESINLFNISRTTSQEVDLSSALDGLFIFEPDEKLIKLLEAKGLPEKKQSVDILKSASLTRISENQIKNILMIIFIPDVVSVDTFGKWWDVALPKTDNIRYHSPIENVRSIQEIHNCLRDESVLIGKLQPDVADKIIKICTSVKSTMQEKDLILWAETISALVKDNKGLEEKLVPENKDVIDLAWPEEISSSSEAGGIWSQLKSAHTVEWLKITKAVKGESYILKNIYSLPWKVWPSLTSYFDTAVIESFISASNRISSPEAILWIWKNSGKLKPESIKKLNYINVLQSISREREGAVWQSAVKDLKKLLLENPDFQKQILSDRSDSVLLDFLEKLNSSLALGNTDKQSLIVKISRHTPAIKNLLKTEKAKRIISSQEPMVSLPSEKGEVYMTSVKSYHEKLRELEDIINRQIPENTEAIAVARAHGDLRENAEYTAAKDRQKFLSETRAMLEKRIMTTVPTDFSDVVVKDKIISGCTVSLKYGDGTEETFHILGAWDSNPSKKYVSYETELGKILIGKTTGNQIILPDGRQCTITGFKPVSEEIKAELGREK